MKVVLSTLISEFDDDIKKITDIEILGTITSSDDVEYDLKQYIKLDPDVIILNRYLFEDVVNAVKLIRELREIKPSQRFIIITGKYEPDFMKPLVNIGIFDFIIDDFSLSNVKDALFNPRAEFDFEEAAAVKKEKVKSDKSLNLKLPMVPKVIIKSVFKESVSFLEIGNKKNNIGLKYAKYLKSKNFKVLFLDYDFMNPVSKEYLKAPNDIYDLLDSYEQSKKINGIENHTKLVDGVTVLSACFNYINYHHITGETLKEFHRDIKKQYDYVVVNVNPYILDVATHSAITEVDRLYLCGPGDNKNDLMMLNNYFDLINERIASVEGIIITDYKGSSLTSIEIEAEVSKSILCYLESKNLASGTSKLFGALKDRKLAKNFKKLGR